MMASLAIEQQARLWHPARASASDDVCTKLRSRLPSGSAGGAGASDAGSVRADGSPFLWCGEGGGFEDSLA